MQTAKTPNPPYYAVIFSSKRTEGDRGYGRTSDRMVEACRAAAQGFSGIESAHEEDGFGITVSYWASEEAISGWKANLEHRAAQDAGKSAWYAGYSVRIAKVERAYGGPPEAALPGDKGSHSGA